MFGRRQRARTWDGPPVPAVLYTRPGCHLCEELKQMLAAAGLPPHELVEIDVGTDPELEALHGGSIPVLEIGGRVVVKGRADARALRRRFERVARAWQARGRGAGERDTHERGARDRGARLRGSRERGEGPGA
jgi:hypothetical protein